MHKVILHSLLILIFLSLSHASKINRFTKINKQKSGKRRRLVKKKILKVSNDVSSWLERNNFKRFEKEFARNDIETNEDLYQVYEPELITIGIPFRKLPRMLKELNKLRCKSKKRQYKNSCQEELQIKKRKKEARKAAQAKEAEEATKQIWIKTAFKRAKRNAKKLKKQQKEKKLQQEQEKKIHKQIQIKVLCIDRSGSMSDFPNIKSGLDSWIQGITVGVLARNILWSIVTFDDIIEKPVFNQSLLSTTSIDADWISPRGSTALYDGILAAIETADLISETSSQVEVVIFTDGHENDSKRIDLDELCQLITLRRDERGWVFTFLAANQNAVETATKLCVETGRALTVDAKGMVSGFEFASKENHFTPEQRAISAALVTT